MIPCWGTRCQLEQWWLAFFRCGQLKALWFVDNNSHALLQGTHNMFNEPQAFRPDRYGSTS